MQLYILALPIKHPSYYEPVEAITTGSGSKRLKERDFLNLQIKLPSKAEQDQIAHSLIRLSQRIEFESRISVLFQIQHQYLLTQMFI